MNIFTIKIIALILMLIDHIGEFFPDSPICYVPGRYPATEIMAKALNGCFMRHIRCNFWYCMV